MKNMKRFLSMLLASLMVVCLGACGNSTTGSNTSGSGNVSASDTAGSTSGSGSEEVYGEGYVLRVGMNCSAAPFGWTQDDDSNGA